MGAVNGQLQPVFTKLSTLHAKNSFSLAIVSGDLFGDDNQSVSDLLDGKIPVPLPTYFTVGASPLPQRIIEKIEKDEEVIFVKVAFPFALADWSAGLPESPFSRQAQHHEDVRGRQDRYTWWTT